MKHLARFFIFLGDFSKRVFYKLARVVYLPKPTAREIAYSDFCKAGGEELRFAYDFIDTNSVVFDLGGYKGEWSGDIYSRYRPKIYVFEVYKPYFENIQKRFLKNPDIQVYNYGLAGEDRVEMIAVDEYSTSTFKKSSDMVKISLRDVEDFFSREKIAQVDLMKINIEGGEYELLERLINTSLIKRVKNLQIQFHDFVPNAIEKMNWTREKLNESHFPAFKYDFIWENWTRREDGRIK